MVVQLPSHAPGPAPSGRGRGRVKRFLRRRPGSRFLLVVGVMLSTTLLLGFGVVAGLLLRDDEVDRLELDLAAARTDAPDRSAGMAAAQAERDLLDVRIEDLETDTDGQRTALDALQQELGAKNAELLALRLQVPLIGEFDDLNRRYGDLQGQYDALALSFDALDERMAELTPIESAELAENPLYLDSSVEGVFYTRALCTGSMEPTISCDDLLILNRAQSPTDLDEGDIIYFRKPTADCSGTIEGRFTLHRVVNVLSTQQGLRFQTKGDAFAFPDACLVNQEDVLFELLAQIRGSRITE